MASVVAVRRAVPAVVARHRLLNNRVVGGVNKQLLGYNASVRYASTYFTPGTCSV